MNLACIVYVSQALVHFNDASLDKLASLAAQKNNQFDITGYLYYQKGIFIQYLEGSQLHVRQLFSNIKKDSRHKVLNMQTNEAIVKRKFPLWKMRQLQKDELSQINMEHILIDYMMHCARVQNKILNEEIIWRIVDKLSKLRAQI